MRRALLALGLLLAFALPAAAQAPACQVDPFWPKPLPNRWGIGQAAGVAVDARDHVWVIHRPRTMTADERGAAQTPPLSSAASRRPRSSNSTGMATSCRPGAGRATTRPGRRTNTASMSTTRTMSGSPATATNDHVLLKFTRDGKFLLQIGKKGETGGSNDPDRLGRPADVEVDPATNEIFVADGYGNRRVIVFDAETGAYKRHWGAYGEKPPATTSCRPMSPAIAKRRRASSAIPCIASGWRRTGCCMCATAPTTASRSSARTGHFVREFIVAPDTLGSGSVWDMDFLPDPTQSVLLAADGSNNVVWLMGRDGGAMLGRFGRNGRNAGEFHWVHNMAVDSRGNVFTTEVDTGKRVQRFRLVSQLPR